MWLHRTLPSTDREVRVVRDGDVLASTSRIQRHTAAITSTHQCVTLVRLPYMPLSAVHRRPASRASFGGVGAGPTAVGCGRDRDPAAGRRNGKMDAVHRLYRSCVEHDVMQADIGLRADHLHRRGD